MLRGDRLRDLRISHQLTHQALAEKLDVAMRMIARYEASETDPSGDVVRRIADVFNVTTDYLLGRSDDPNPQTPVGDLSEQERAILFAVRSGDLIGAIRAIVNEK